MAVRVHHEAWAGRIAALMPYRVYYHEEILDDEEEWDLLTDEEHLEVHRKLREAADSFKALSYDLSGCFRIRVRHLRVVYEIARGDIAFILAIGPRRDDEVYDLAARRRPNR